MARNVQKSQTLAIHLIRKLRMVEYGLPRLLHNRPDTVEELLDRQIIKEKSLNNDNNEILDCPQLTSTHCEALSLYKGIWATRFFMWRDNSKPSPILR